MPLVGECPYKVVVSCAAVGKGRPLSLCYSLDMNARALVCTDHAQPTAGCRFYGLLGTHRSMDELPPTMVKGRSDQSRVGRLVFGKVDCCSSAPAECLKRFEALGDWSACSAMVGRWSAVSLQNIGQPFGRAQDRWHRAGFVFGIPRTFTYTVLGTEQRTERVSHYTDMFVELTNACVCEHYSEYGYVRQKNKPVTVPVDALTVFVRC
ncbi:hypothetical protein Bbelb_299340 [Branchiostoma belcheri]|nr:hypothetical protein Bbelb_299340 [Branchiostoma belcheri]